MARLTRCMVVTVVFGVLAGVVGADPLRVAALPVLPPELAYEIGSAYTTSSNRPVSVTVCRDFAELRTGLSEGKFDAVFGTCPASSAELQRLGLVSSDTERVVFYYRLAMMLPPGDPKAIFDAADLDRPGLRIGLCTTHAAGPLVEKLKARATVVSSDRELLLDMLELGRLDVVVAMDSSGRLRPDLVVIRFPRAVAGEGAAVPVRAFAAANTTRGAEVKAFLDFCAGADEAEKVMLEHAIMTSDGSDAASYSEGASPRMMPAYRALARQIAMDYAQGGKTCLDLGCGPGEMTVEVARETGMEVTGLDIEPECLVLADQYARSQGLSDRMHWVAADVHALPYPDNSFDLVISRGSIFFWRDQVRALREIRRVLKPGGYAFIGGGWGRLLSNEEWQKAQPGVASIADAAVKFHFPYPLKNVPALMCRAGITDYRYITEGGAWIEFRK